MDAATKEDAIDKRTVFVICGRNDEIRQSVFGFLRSIGLNPIGEPEMVNRLGGAAPYSGDVVDAAFRCAQAVVAVLTGDDLARLLPNFCRSDDKVHDTRLTPQARPTVLFKAGMALACRPERTILVQVGEVRPFEDVEGRYIVQLDNSPEKRKTLAARLEGVGCQTNTNGTDWYTAGRFHVEPPTLARRIAVLSGELNRLQPSFEYNRRVADFFLNVIPSITSLSLATVKLLYEPEKDKVRSRKEFEEEFKKYQEQYDSGLRILNNSSPGFEELKKQANRAIEIFANDDLSVSFNAIYLDLVPFYAADEQIRKQSIIVRSDESNQGDKLTFRGHTISLRTCCLKGIRSTHEFLGKLEKAIFDYAKENAGE